MKSFKYILFLFFTFTLSACGGGGGSSSTPTTTSTGPAATYTISGKVSGPWAEGVTVTLGGDSTATTTTAADGTYSFSGLAAGNYTITPSLSGYSYSPAAPAVTLSADTTEDFTASSTIAASTISGSLTYTGAKTGGGAIRVYSSSCTTYGSCEVYGATHFPPQGGAFTYNYQIRGIPPGTYVVKAGFNPLGTGAPNVANPGGKTTSFTTVAGTDYPGENITINDPTSIAAPVATTPSFSVGDYSEMFTFNAPSDTNGREIADSYTISWGTDTAATNGGSKTFTAQGPGSNTFFLTSADGLTNGSYYFKFTSINHDITGTLQSVSSTIQGPIPVGPQGSSTVSGTVNFTGTATGPMIVGMVSTTNHTIYTTTITNPTSPQSYSIPSVPSGSFITFAVVDNNKDGKVDAGDFQNISNSLTAITVGGTVTTGNNITLSSDNSSVIANTDHTYNDSTAIDSYNLIGGVTNQLKKVVHLVLFSGPNIAVPYDMDYSSGTHTWISLGSTAPSVGDTYQYKVFYSDGTSEIKTASVSAVLSLSNMAQNLTGDNVTNGTVPAPYFSWTVPSSPLSTYLYRVSVYGTNTNITWNDKNDLSSSILHVLYNADGSANPSSLTSGDIMDLKVSVVDSDGNSGTRVTSFTDGP